MTVWILKCKECGADKEVDLGFNLYKLGKVYIYCENCGRNTFHEIVKCLEEEF